MERTPIEPSEELLKSDAYLIWSDEHRAWWRQGGWGYTKGLIDAGRFTRDHALSICRAAIPTSAALGNMSEFPVRLADVAEFTSEQLVPMALMRGGRR